MTDNAETPKSALRPPPEDGIGERIKDRRKEWGLSVEQLSALTVKFDHWKSKGVSSASIFRYEKVGPDGSLPGARELCLLCAALNVTPNWLLLGDEGDKDAKADRELANAARTLVARVMSGDEWPDGIGGWKDFEHSEKLREVKQQIK